MSSAAALKIHAPLLIATATIFIAVDIGMIGLRVWARRLKKLKLGADDYCCMVSCLLTVGTAITVIVETSRKTIGYESHIPLTSDVTNAEFAFLPYNHLANGSSWTRKDQLPPVLPARLRQNRESHLFSHLHVYDNMYCSMDHRIYVCVDFPLRHSRLDFLALDREKEGELCRHRSPHVWPGNIGLLV